MRPVFLAVALASALVAGCTSPTAASDPFGIVAEASADPVLRSVQRAVTLEHGVTVGDAGTYHHACVDSGSSRLVLEIAPHAGALVVELVQKGGRGQVLLHAIPPAAADTTPMLVDSSTLYAEQDEHGRARLAIPDPQPGKWAFDIHADGVVIGFEGTLYATSLVAPVDGFTAIPA